MKLAFVIIFPLCIIGVFTFLVMNDQGAQNELRQELSSTQRQAIEQLGPLVPDYMTIQSYRSNAEMMRSMDILFRAQCASCHAPLGTGQAGPNLCDEYYLIVDNIPDLYTSIADGSISKGMVPFRGILTDNELILMASYVANLRGSAKSGKVPEGKIIAPWPKK
ncbi:MAG: cytochrome c [Phycisphaerae bacterium]|nr:cytochrome c [Phycisphaerae bacterium]